MIAAVNSPRARRLGGTAHKARRGCDQACRPTPQVEIIVERRARRQVLGDRPPLTPGAQDIHQAIDDFAHDDMTPIAAALGRRNERLHKRPFLVCQIARIAQPTSVAARPRLLARPHRRPQTDQAASLNPANDSDDSICSRTGSWEAVMDKNKSPVRSRKSRRWQRGHRQGYRRRQVAERR